MRRTFKYRLYPTPAQETALSHILEECRWLYNRLLEERILAYEACDMSVGLYDQHARLPALKLERPSLSDVHSQVLQNVAVRLDLAMKAFFRRVKTGEKPGFPRFRGAGRYDSFCYPQAGRKGGYWVADDGQSIYLSGIGMVPIILHRPLRARSRHAVCGERQQASGSSASPASLRPRRCPRPTP